MLWFLSALGYSLFLASYLLANHHFRISARMMILWRGMGGLIVLTPFIPFLPWPHNPMFYLVLATMGILAGFYERQTYDIAGSGNAGGLSRLLPLSIWVTFFAWLIISPEIRRHYGEHPLHALVVFGCLGICGAGLFWMQRSRVDAHLLRAAFPIIILRGIVDAMNKTAMIDSAEIFPSNLVIYIWWISVWITLTTLVLSWRATGKIMPENPFRKAYLAPAVVITFILIGLMACKGAAMNFAPNPAYVTATALLSTLWVALYHRWRNISDPSHLWAGVLIVIGTLCLVFVGG